MRSLPFFATVGAALTITLAAISCPSLKAQERSPIYPYDVTVGGQAAVPPDGPAEVFARISQPVAPNAKVEVDTAGEMIIVNIFEVNEYGSPLPGAEGSPTVIMVQSGTGFGLDATMDNSVLHPGRYGMNIVLQNKGTARVLFTVGTPERLAMVKPGQAAPATPAAPKSTPTPPPTTPTPAPAAPAAPPAGLNMSGATLPGGDAAPAQSDTPSTPDPASTPPAAPGINFAGTAAFGIEGPGSAPAATPSSPSSAAPQEEERRIPDGTMRLFFQYAKQAQFEKLRDFKAPDCDGDVREICEVGDGEPNDQKRFTTYFGDSKVIGAARVEGNLAEVDFTFGDKQEREDTMTLERIDGVWYLKSF